jgi:hypothetical protein
MTKMNENIISVSLFLSSLVTHYKTLQSDFQEHKLSFIIHRHNEVNSYKHTKCVMMTYGPLIRTYCKHTALNYN